MEREADKVYSEKLIETNIDEEVLEDVSRKLHIEIMSCKVCDLDDYNYLTMKKIKMDEEIFPIVNNFNVCLSEYNEVYGEILKRIEVFKISISDVNELTLREKRLMYYSSSS